MRCIFIPKKTGPDRAETTPIARGLRLVAGGVGDVRLALLELRGVHALHLTGAVPDEVQGVSAVHVALGHHALRSGRRLPGAAQRRLDADGRGGDDRIALAETHGSP